MKIRNIKNINLKKLSKSMIFTLGFSLGLTGCNIKKQEDFIQVQEEIVKETSKPIETSIPVETPKPQLNVIETPKPTAEPVEEIEKKVVAITFDDGPSKYTMDLLNILEENDVEATFFVLGSNVKKYPETIEYAYNTGNEIGIHGYSHESFTKMSLEEVRNEILLTKQLIEENAVCSNFVRPPYGSINNNIMENIDATFILWNVDPEDWKLRDKEKIKKEIIDKLNDGDIILFHDLYKPTIDAIEELLPLLKDEYEFVTVSELFDIKEQECEKNKKYYKVKNKNF